MLCSNLGVIATIQFVTTPSERKILMLDREYLHAIWTFYAWFSLGAERAKRARIRALAPLAPSVNTIIQI